LALLAQKRFAMKSRMNAVLLIAGALFFQSAIAQAELASGHEPKAELVGANTSVIDGAKESASEAAVVRRETPLSPRAPERSVAPGKNKVITLPQIPVDQLGLGCAE